MITLNLISGDTATVSGMVGQLSELFVCTPLRVGIALSLLYRTLGYSSLAGIATMLLLFPINSYLTKQLVEAQNALVSATDARIASS